MFVDLLIGISICFSNHHIGSPRLPANLIFGTTLGLFVHLLPSFSGLLDGKASAFVFVTEIPIGVA